MFKKQTKSGLSPKDIFLRLKEKIGLTDRLTLLRHVFLQVYGFVLSPYLLAHLPWAGSVAIMLAFQVLLAYIFMVVLGSRNGKSFLLDLATSVNKALFGLVKFLATCFFLKVLGEKTQKKYIGRFIDWRNQGDDSTTSFTLFFGEPFLFMVRRRNKQDFAKTYDKNFWFWLLFSNLVAVVSWSILTIYGILKVYHLIGLY